MNATAKIVKVLEVRDTREWVEGPDGKWHALPGTGEVHQCSRCGRYHEVHAEVLLDDQTTAIVGTGCMGQESVEVQAAAKAGASAAKTRARNVAKLEALRRELAKAQQLEEEVKRLPLPEITEGRNEYGRRELVMGDASVPLPDWHDDVEERTRTLIECWRANRRGPAHRPSWYVAGLVGDQERRLKSRGA